MEGHIINLSPSIPQKNNMCRLVRRAHYDARLSSFPSACRIDNFIMFIV